MRAKRIDFFLFGYKKITVGENDREKAINRLMRFKLAADMDSEGAFFVSLKDIRRYRRALYGVEYGESEARGLVGALIGYRYRFGIFAALFVAVLFFLFSSGIVWDVRVLGNEELSKYRIEDVLDSAGLREGVRWSSFSNSALEGKILESTPEIAWVNINRRGVVAYVTVKEKDTPTPSDVPLGAYNIVAAEDCVIEEITVRQGIPRVKAGDTVKRGDLLISGVIPPELGGGFVRADGDVIAKTTRTVGVRVCETEITREYSEAKILSSQINFFGISINIFKKYGNLGEECVIIRDKDKLMLPSGQTLPISVIREYGKSYTEKEVRYTSDELVKIAAVRLQSLKIAELSSAELLRARTDGGFFDGGYEIKCEMLVLCEVGEARLIGSTA